jgi:ABC-type uncharacterized transport system permease subunit
MKPMLVPAGLDVLCRRPLAAWRLQPLVRPFAARLLAAVISGGLVMLVSGNTAVVTAKLWAKGIEDGAKVDYVLWFSDVYVRTPKGWRYFFAQASLPLRSISQK